MKYINDKGSIIYVSEICKDKYGIIHGESGEMVTGTNMYDDREEAKKKLDRMATQNGWAVILICGCSSDRNKV